MPRATDIRIDEVRFEFEEYRYRTPIKFGGIASDRVTLLNVHCRVRNREGKSAEGFGSMPLGNVWSYPSRKMGYDQTLGAMKELSDEVCKLNAAHTEYGHPIDLTHALEPVFHRAATELSSRLQLPDPIPALATLVVASPFDAGLHDAFGKLHDLNCYKTYGPEYMNHDLGHYLGHRFAGEWLASYIGTEPQPSMPLYHLVGALDSLTAGDVTRPIADGLPETLAEWIPYNGLTHLKIKLNGDDLNWDVERVINVNRVADSLSREPPASTHWNFSLDFNERCASVDYLLGFLARVKEMSPRAFDRIQYIEQPTARDLKADRHNVMHKAAKVKPVVIDESLLDLDSLEVALEMGYTGAALKACKGQTQSLLLAAAAQKMKLFLCVQDLTCPGASLIHSAGLAAHIPGVAAIEANSRQFVPAANQKWENRFPSIFVVKDGAMSTSCLTGPGLGAVLAASGQ
jgi:L-alanine-DL-glutamate epimerase-like enolase superfamily enzyme